MDTPKTKQTEQQDIEQKEKMEESLRQIKLVVDNSCDAIIGTTLDGIITSWNGGAVRMFGYSSDEVVGKSGAVLFPPEMWEKIPELLEKIKTKEFVADYDSWGLKKDGSRFDLAISLSPIVSEDGMVIGASVVERDISERKRTIDELSKLKKAVNRSTGVIFMTDRDGLFTFINNRFTALYGYTADEVVGKVTPRILKGGSKTSDDYKIFWDTLLSKKEIKWEIKNKRKDGTIIDIEASVSPIIDDNGEIIGFLAVEYDITDRKASEEKIKKSESVFRALTDYSPLCIKALDNTGKLTFVNKTGRKEHFLKEEDIVGWDYMMSVDLEYRGIFANGLKESLGGKVVEFDFRHQDGTSTHEWCHGILSPMIDEKGVVTGVVFSSFDITERRKADEELRTSADKFKTYTEKAPLGIFVVDGEWNFIEANPMALKMSGYSLEEILNISIKEFLSSEYFEKGLQSFNELKLNGYAQTNLLVRKKNGEDFWVNLVSTKIGENRYIAFCEDITKRKESEKHIRDLSEVRSKFISIISHQLGTPITAVNWNLETVLNGDFGELEDVTRKALSSIHKSSVEITNRIHDLLVAMDIEEGRVVFKTEEASLNSIIIAIMNEERKKCELKNITCEYSVPEKDIPEIEVDVEKIRMVVKKFIENAVVYTKEKGKVTVSLGVRNSVVHFEVSDTGIGIPKQEQHHIFSRFFRASNASAMQTDSFGLGLFIAKSFIEQHGGNIGFESEEGKGSTFWFEIPIKSNNND